MQSQPRLDEGLDVLRFMEALGDRREGGRHPLICSPAEGFGELELALCEGHPDIEGEALKLLERQQYIASVQWVAALCQGRDFVRQEIGQGRDIERAHRPRRVDMSEGELSVLNLHLALVAPSDEEGGAVSGEEPLQTFELRERLHHGQKLLNGDGVGAKEIEVIDASVCQVASGQRSTSCEIEATL